MKVVFFSAFPHEVRHIVRNLRGVAPAKVGNLRCLTATHLGHDVIVVLTGMGMKNAEEAIERLLHAQTPDLIVSLGFGGALYDEASIGDLVVARRLFLVSPSDVPLDNAKGHRQKVYLSDSLDLNDDEPLFAAFSDKMGVGCGTVLTLENWMEKRDLRRIIPQDSTLPVCDMETFPLAKAALKRGLRFLAIRSITDRTNEEIPAEFLTVGGESGHYSLARALWLPLRRPHLMRTAIRLGYHSRRASERLWHSFHALLETL